MREIWLEAGESLFRAGEPATTYFFLVDGTVRLGTAMRTAPDETVGWLDAVLERPRSADATAEGAVHVFEIPISDFTAVVEDSLDLSMGMLEERARKVDAMVPATPRPVRETSTAEPTDDSFARTMVTLREAGCLRTARTQTLASLAECATSISLRAGEAFTAGDNGLWLVARGLTECAERTYGAGMLVAGTGAFVERARPRLAKAVHDTDLLQIAFDDWFDVAEENFDLVRSTLVWIEEERQALG
jgi:CRP-like cAMP-binding protein